uniref:Uncharacterized protein n=1 Tax=Anthurium amnicola TaxID=1678845 RepID=A0A1D1YCL9_9ARAE
MEEGDPKRRPHPPLPENYVSLAQLQEQRRLKLDRQRREQEEEAAEAERERLRKLEEEEEAEETRRRTQIGTLQPAHRVGGGRGRNSWGRKRGEVGASSAVGGEGEKEGGRGGGNGRGRTRGPPRSGRSRPAIASESPNPEAATAACGVADPLDRKRTGRRKVVKPDAGPVEEEVRRKGQSEGGGLALEPKAMDGPRNAGPALPCRGREGAKEKRDRRGKVSSPTEPNATTVEKVAWKLQDLTITAMRAKTMGGDSVERLHRRPTAGRRGGYPSFRDSGALGPRRRLRPAAGESMVWVNKAGSS